MEKLKIFSLRDRQRQRDKKGMREIEKDSYKMTKRKLHIELHTKKERGEW